MCRKPRNDKYSTIGHVTNVESISRFHALQKKWQHYRISDNEHRWLDMTESREIGKGGQEIAVFTFARHQRLAALSGDDCYRIWLSAGAHWNDRWHDAQGNPYCDVPAIGIVRGIYDRASVLEPLRLLAITSCSNAQFLFDEITSALRAKGYDTRQNSFHGNPRCCWVQARPEDVLAACEHAATCPCPAMDPIAASADAAVSASIEGLMQFAEEAAKWKDEFVISDCELRGVGRFVVYAYTYEAIFEAALLEGADRYPVKIGYTQAMDYLIEGDVWSGISRAFGQVAFTEPIRILGVVQCADGRAAEAAVHKQIAQHRIIAPAKEWFLTNKAEIDRLMYRVRHLSPG